MKLKIKGILSPTGYVSQVGAVPKVNVDNGTAPVCYGLSRSYASMFRSG